MSHEAPDVLLDQSEIFFVFYDFSVPLFHLKSDVLAEAAQQRLEEAVPFYLELDEVLGLAAALVGISGHDEANQPASVWSN